MGNLTGLLINVTHCLVEYDICYKNHRNRGYKGMETIILHELIHDLQSCNGTLWGGEDHCKSSLCAEIEAYSRANCRAIKDPIRHKKCVKGKYKEKGTLGSGVGFSSGFYCSKAEYNANFEKLYEKCKKLSQF